MKFNISIDFDETICKGGKFVAPHIIPFEPIDGAKEALTKLDKYFRIIVFSVRAQSKGGQKAIEKWMDKYEIPYSKVTAVKQMSVFYVDNRGIRFNGNWKDTLKQIATLEVE